VALIRRDFEQLSRLLGEQSEQKRAAWQGTGGPAEGRSAPAGPLAEIDRIVLYIDDLDRCPPQRVVEVMQAVHLLLAFPLFVVVVAVDSRWLLRSLEKGYPDFLVLDRDIEGDGPRTLARWASTPQSYLEKIFQIPVHIRPMNRTGFSALLEDLAGPVTEDRASDGGGSGRASTGEKIPSGEGVTGGATEKARADGKGQGRGEEPDAGPSPELYPTNLELTRAEVDFMGRFHGLIGTPRGLKRFVNTYRLLRISVPPAEWAAFRDPDEGEYRHAILLLALLVGHAHEAGSIFQDLMRHPGDGPWGAFVDGLRPRQRGEGEGDDDAGGGLARNAVAGKIPDAELPRWERIHRSLAEAESLAGEPLAPFRKWTPRVARYAFYPIRFTAANSGP
jgi:hypothetical protein